MEEAVPTITKIRAHLSLKHEVATTLSRASPKQALTYGYGAIGQRVRRRIEGRRSEAISIFV